MFFEMLLQHWFVSLLVLTIYVRLTFKTVRRYHYEILRGKLHVRRFSWSVYVLEFLLAPLLVILFKRQDESERERRRAENERLRHEEEEGRWRANMERATRHQKWLKDNPPTLYYNTIDGITAVMRPANYERCKIDTKRALRNGLWTNEQVLMPIHETYLFVREEARQHLLLVFKTESVIDYVCGWLSDFDDIVERNDIKLEMKNDIFVPFVNESVLPYSAHLQRGRASNPCVELVDAQAPKEMQPV